MTVSDLPFLRCAPNGVGLPSLRALLDALLASARRQPTVLIAIGEPLSGKSTILSHLLADVAAEPDVRPFFIRWGDCLRAAKKLNLLPPERLPGDQTPAEFRRLTNLASHVTDLAARAAGDRHSLAVVEYPGVTAVSDGPRVRGLDRGFSMMRQRVDDPGCFFLAVCAEDRVRQTHLAGRDITDVAAVQSATPLAANRVREQVSDLICALDAAGKLARPEGLPTALTSNLLEQDPELRATCVFEGFLPYLLTTDLAVPSERVLVAQNPWRDTPVPVDEALLDRFAFVNALYGV